MATAEPLDDLQPEFRGRIYDSIIDTIGATPLVRIRRLAEAEGCHADLVAKQTSPMLDHTTPAIDTIYEDLTATGHALASLLVRRINEEPVETLQSVRPPELRFRTECQAKASASA